MKTTRHPDLLCLSHLRWGFVYQRPNHLMSRFARERRVFFVEEPITDGADPTPRLELTSPEPGLTVVVPHLPPGLTADAAERQTQLLLEQLATEHEIRTPVLWFYTPMAVGYAPDVAPSAVVYDCMDELTHFKGASPQLRFREAELLRRAHLVFTGGESLFEAKRDLHPKVFAFPSSVDHEHFARARREGIEPDDQRSIPHPRIGFFGVVDERMDLDLLREAATRRPGLHFVVIGPVVKIDPATLPRLPNIHWLGQKSYAELPEYLAGWDVAMMPFAKNDATRFISPTKTLEYLAAGKAVVSTSIADVVKPYGERGLVRIADEAFAFTAAIDAALDAPPEECAKRDAFLARTSWDRTWAEMKALIEQVEAARPSERRTTGRLTADESEEVAACSTI